MKLPGAIALLFVVTACRKDAADYYKLLPSTEDIGGARQVAQEEKAGTYVRVFQVKDRFTNSEFALNMALQPFSSADSSAAWNGRMTITPEAFASASGEGARARGVALDSVHGEAIELTGLKSPRHTAVFARLFTPGPSMMTGRSILMTQAVVATDKCAVVLQVGGSGPTDETLALLQKAAAIADARIQKGC